MSTQINPKLQQYVFKRIQRGPVQASQLSKDVLRLFRQNSAYYELQALRKAGHITYIKKDKMWVLAAEASGLCGLCGGQTRMTATQRCDRCYELEKRVLADPALARQILGDVVVVMKNDFPAAVASSQAVADQFREQIRQVNPDRVDWPTCHVHFHTFTVDKEPRL